MFSFLLGTTCLTMLTAWLKSMLSVERSKPLTKTERFTQWSSLLYVVVGTSMLFIPSLWGFLYKVELLGRSTGYIQLGGLAFVVEGYLLVIASKSEHKVPGHGHINITVLTRLILVNMSLTILYLKGTAPVRCIAFIAALDNSLAVGVFLVWISTEEGATLGLFFKEIFDLLLRFPVGPCSSIAVLLLGIVQFSAGLYLKDVTRLSHALSLDPFLGYSGLFLSFYFSLNAAHAVLYISNGQAVSTTFNKGCVFYRVAINILVLFVLGAANRIETSLSVFLISVEMILAAFILVSLSCDKDNYVQGKEK